MKVRATQKGWYNKRIVKEGEIFEYAGTKPPMWVEKVGAADVKAETKEPDKEPDKTPENKQNNKPVNKNNKAENKTGETLLEKNKQIQDAQNKETEEKTEADKE